MGATGATAITGAGSAYMQAQQGRLERDMARWNARMLQLQADDAIKRGGEQERLFRQDVGRLRGKQRSGYAAQNVDVDYGIAEEIDKQTQEIAELDALQIRNNAAREAMGFASEAALTEGRGNAEFRMARAKAGLTLTTTGGDAFATYRKYNPERFEKKPKGQ